MVTWRENWLIGKDPDAGKDWRQEEKGMTEDEMVGWHHWLDGHEFEQALGVSDGQGSLVCCSPRGHKQSDMTEWLKWTEILFPHSFCNLKMNEHTLNLKRDEVWGWLDMVIHYSLTQSCPILCDPMNSRLSFTVSSNLLKLMSIESMMPSNRLVLSPTSLPALSLSEHKGFSNESALCTRWPEYSNFSFSISPSNEYSGLIFFRIDWFDLLALQGTFRSLLQHHNWKASVLWCSAFFMVQLSYLPMTTGKTIAMTIWTFVSKVMSLLFNTLSRFVIALLPRSKHILIS